ncbi:integration host factor subunit alpha [Sphingopyxis fribergensis]|uniref:Integration host factor subunit alpha n=2 Tax=Sphingomonadaceae TaxID=41297 RepID=A0A0A7PDR9_9SPHN|nr:integration host factor subunit alpha [Sphingopyxis fribergensis]
MVTGLVTVGAVRGAIDHICFSEGEGINMTAGTLTRADIATRINQQIGLSRNESASIVESILDHMSDALAVGQNVKISGFGTFVLRDKAQRIGRNPKTGIEVPILPRRVMTFRASQTMRARVAGK